MARPRAYRSDGAATDDLIVATQEAAAWLASKEQSELRSQTPVGDNDAVLPPVEKSRRQNRLAEMRGLHGSKSVDLCSSSSIDLGCDLLERRSLSSGRSARRAVRRSLRRGITSRSLRDRLYTDTRRSTSVDLVPVSDGLSMKPVDTVSEIDRMKQCANELRSRRLSRRQRMRKVEAALEPERRIAATMRAARMIELDRQLAQLCPPV